MLGQIVETAAALADQGSLTVNHALDRYRPHIQSPPTSEGQLWVSVAFLINRQEPQAGVSDETWR